MRFSLTLIDTNGAVLPGREVELFGSEGGGLLELGSGSSDDAGRVVIDAELPRLPVLGLWIDGLPAPALPLSVSADGVDLGVLVVSEGEPLLETLLFPCVDGDCYALPKALYAQLLKGGGASDDELAEARAALEAAQALADKSKAELAAARGAADTLKQELAASRKETEQAKAELNASRKETEQAKAELNASRKETEQAKAEVSSAQTQLATTQQALAEAKLSAEASGELTPTTRSTSEAQALGAVLRSTATGVESARDSLSSEGSRYALSEVQVTMKGLLVQGEDMSLKMAFVESEALTSVDAAHLSVVKFAVTPSEGASPPATHPDDQPPAPDVTGYTRELAQRKLTAAGLLSTLSFLSVDPRGEGARDVGRVVRQQPAAGTPTAPGSHVRLFLGKADRSA